MKTLLASGLLAALVAPPLQAQDDSQPTRARTDAPAATSSVDEEGLRPARRARHAANSPVTDASDRRTDRKAKVKAKATDAVTDRARDKAKDKAKDKSRKIAKAKALKHKQAVRKAKAKAKASALKDRVKAHKAAKKAAAKKLRARKDHRSDRAHDARRPFEGAKVQRRGSPSGGRHGVAPQGGKRPKAHAPSAHRPKAHKAHKANRGRRR